MLTFHSSITPEAARETLGAFVVTPGVEPWQGFLTEAWITFQLMLTILGSTNSARKDDLFMPVIPIGVSVAVGIMAAVGY